MPDEFGLIQQVFFSLTEQRDEVILGAGDDAAIIQPPAGMQLVVSVDTFLAGTHFFPNTLPAAIGHKALAVNLSDIAAMGAQPAWVTMALTQPTVDEPWLHAFADGFAQLAQQHHVSLIGGDLTRGPLAITVQIGGWVPAGQAIRRSGAQIGDGVFVTGRLGEARLALQARQNQQMCDESWNQRLDYPAPRVAVGEQLRGLATAAIDLSDGLLQDLQHILTASQCGATINVDAIPVADNIAQQAALAAALTGGDDYELCFTAPVANTTQVQNIAAQTGVAITQIGQIIQEPDLRCVHADGSPYTEQLIGGFQHF